MFYDDPLLQAAYVKAALEVTSPEYLSKLEADLGPQFAAWNQALSDEYGDLPLPWAKLRERARQMRQRIQPVQAVYANTPLGTENVLDIGNFMAWPVEIIGLDTGQRVISLERSWVVSDSQQLLVDGVDTLALKPLAAGVKDVAYARFRIPSDVISLTVTNPITVVTRLLGGRGSASPTRRAQLSAAALGRRATDGYGGASIGAASLSCKSGRRSVSHDHGERRAECHFSTNELVLARLDRKSPDRC